MEPTPGELVIVTGMTGAGRSTAAKELEDLGYFVVDNLPPTLVRDVVRLVDDSRGIDQPIAVVVDVRSGSFFDSLQANRHQGVTGRPTTLLFLEATDDVLVRRQEAARRPHPLQGSGRLLHGLQREREVLADVRGDADVVIDTTNLNVHGLTDRIAQGVTDGDLPDTVRPDQLASFLVAVMRGMSGCARDGGSAEEVLAIADAAVAAIPGPSPSRDRR